MKNALETLIGALSYAERLGICHRDFKPQNTATNLHPFVHQYIPRHSSNMYTQAVSAASPCIFLTGDVLKIGNFGSANKQVATGELKKIIRGSSFFLSPELNCIRQSEGQPETPYDSIRSDYSLGVTILCMALLDMPQQLAQYSQIHTATEMYMKRVARYPGRRSGWKRC